MVVSIGSLAKAALWSMQVTRILAAITGDNRWPSEPGSDRFLELLPRQLGVRGVIQQWFLLRHPICHTFLYVSLYKFIKKLLISQMVPQKTSA
jgi:hypothetical protein